MNYENLVEESFYERLDNDLGKTFINRNTLFPIK